MTEQNKLFKVEYTFDSPTNLGRINRLDHSKVELTRPFPFVTGISTKQSREGVIEQVFAASTRGEFYSTGPDLDSAIYTLVLQASDTYYRLWQTPPERLGKEVGRYRWLDAFFAPKTQR